MRKAISFACVLLVGCGGLVWASAEPALCAPVQSGVDSLPCYVFAAPSSPGAEVKLLAPYAGPIHDVSIPVANAYCEYHGWAIEETCLRFAELSPEDIAAYIQSHANVRMWINGLEVPGSFIVVTETTRQPSWGSGPCDGAVGDPMWLVEWCFGYPPGVVQPGIHIVSVAYNWSGSLECDCKTPEMLSGTVTQTVAVLYE